LNPDGNDDGSIIGSNSKAPNDAIARHNFDRRLDEFDG
jgi:hypothetical protein